MDSQALSVHLYDVLEDIGVSGDVRRRYWENAMQREIPIRLLCNRRPYPAEIWYQFGSHCEGTTTPDLRSDLDELVCWEDTPVMANIEDAPAIGQSLLLVTDTNTKPGYFQLQLVCNGIPQGNVRKGTRRTIVEMESTCKLFNFEADGSGRLCLEHMVTGKDLKRNGPADTDDILGCDFVYALRCQRVPRSATAWIYRLRRSGWLERDCLQRVLSYDAFFVGVGHPKSRSKSIEWRISFSLQERELMINLNQVQHKCYVLLKMIKRDLIEESVGKSISSYHMKTCLLYTIETFGRDTWTKDNLILCTRLCLERLLGWVQERNCPNYFIPGENMFDRLDKSTLERVKIRLKHVLSLGDKFPLSLKCDNINQVLEAHVEGGTDVYRENALFYRTKTVLRKYTSSAYRILVLRNHLLTGTTYPFPKKPSLYLRELEDTIVYLQNVDSVPEHTKEDTRMSLDALLPHLFLHKAQCMASNELSLGIANHFVSVEVRESLNRAECDIITVRLTRATWYARTNQFEICERMLMESENTLNKRMVFKLCGCYNESTMSYACAIDQNLSNEKFRTFHTIGCMAFLPCQVDLVHPALLYEMYRSVYTPPRSRCLRTEAWYDWIVVDSQAYLYFLRYVIRSQRTNTTTRSPDDDEKMKIVQNSFGHPETSMNLLGWIYMSEGRTSEALKWFCASLRLKPLHNAAKWHLAVLLYTVFTKSA